MRRPGRRSRSTDLSAALRSPADPQGRPEPGEGVEFAAVQPVPGLLRTSTGSVGAEIDPESADLPRAAADPLGGRPVPPTVLSALRERHGTGDPLPPGVIAPMQRELGRDLSAVRLHTDPGADRLARSVQSVAFTRGSDIYFRRGAYRPGTADGSHLLAHELAHVGQDGGGAQSIIGRADDPAEVAADRAADRLAPLLRRGITHAGSGSPDLDRAGPTPAGPGGSADGAVRRRFSVSSADVNALRSKAGVRKGARTRDTLDKIGRLLDRHPARRDELEMIQSLLTIGALGNHWLDKHRAEQDWGKINLVETIVAEASRDHAQLLAQRRYVADARAGSGLGGPTDPRASSTPLTMQVNDSPASQAGKLATAARAPRVADQQRAPAVDLVASLGLTEAEILAIKTFTNEDYKYMNPAIVGDDVWMGDQQPALQNLFTYQATSSYGRHGDVQADLRKLKAEGVLHGGVLMQAVAKLEPKVGKVYRGERLTQAEFDQKYGQGTVNFKTFASMSTDASIGRGFSTRLPNRKTQTLSVFCEFDVIDARDIGMLSVNHTEKEWLLLPGASFAVTSVKDITAEQKPVDGITRWLEVRLRQTAALRRI